MHGVQFCFVFVPGQAKTFTDSGLGKVLAWFKPVTNDLGIAAKIVGRVGSVTPSPLAQCLRGIQHRQ